MYLFGACYNALRSCFMASSSSNNDDDDDAAVFNERTGLVVRPPSMQSFSGGFVSYYHSQKGVIWGALNLVVYYGLALVAFSFGVFERWSIIDTIYYATITFTTIGYGDLTPTTDGGRLFAALFAIYGIFILGYFIGVIGEKMVDQHNSLVAEVEERARHVMLFDHHDEDASSRESTTPQQQQPSSIVKRKGIFTIVGEILLMELPIILLVLLIGISYGTYYRGWSVSTSIYFAIITTSTVGYGDLYPNEAWSRGLCILVLPLAVAVFCEVLGRVAGAYLEAKIARQEQKFLSRTLTLTDIRQMDVDKDGQVSWGEFLAFMLMAMQKVEKEDIEKLKKVFDSLDVAKNGLLDKDDLAVFTARMAERASTADAAIEESRQSLL